MNPSSVMNLINKALNQVLHYDHNAQKQLPPMAGKKVKLTILPIDFSLVIALETDRINIEPDQGQNVDTTISGKPSALFAMGTKQHIPGLDGVMINGDATTGQFIADLLKQLDPDWEEAWCDWLGEVPGYHVAQTLKGIREAGSALFRSFTRSSKDYMLYDDQNLISPHEMETFMDEVDDLNADMVRIERKWQQLNKPS